MDCHYGTGNLNFNFDIGLNCCCYSGTGKLKDPPVTIIYFYQLVSVVIAVNMLETSPVNARAHFEQLLNFDVSVLFSHKPSPHHVAPPGEITTAEPSIIQPGPRQRHHQSLPTDCHFRNIFPIAISRFLAYASSNCYSVSRNYICFRFAEVSYTADPDNSIYSRAGKHERKSACNYFRGLLN